MHWNLVDHAVLANHAVLVAHALVARDGGGWGSGWMGLWGGAALGG